METNAKPPENQEGWGLLAGKRVIVIWTDQAARRGYEWVSYVMDWADCDHVKFTGVQSPEGHRHDGSSVIVHNSLIRDIIEWPFPSPSEKPSGSA